MIRFIKSLLATLLIVAGLAGCASPDVTQYTNESPELDLVRFFQGKTQAWGMFQKRGGEVVKRFHVVINGTWLDEKLVLDEHFTYSDGTRERRVWTLVKDDQGRWTGTADDVIGTATGELAGNAFRWRYTLALPVDGTVYHVHFDDWMFLMDENTLINRASMSKFGIELGQVTLFFQRKAPQ